MTVVIEVATQPHLADCERLWGASWSVLFPDRPSGPDAPFATFIEGEEVYIARRNGAVDGFISLWRPDAFIHFLIVDASRRGHGIGTALLTFALGKLTSPVRLKCGLANTPAQAFYTARGARMMDTVTDGDEPYILYAFATLPDAEPQE